MNETLDTVYLVMRKHFVAGNYPEDFFDYGDTFIGVFEDRFAAKEFVKALPIPGDEYTEYTEDREKYPEMERNFKLPRGKYDVEYIIYKIVPVIKF